ncbi:MAG: CDP-alcohol phosphatidyltransferase family protein [Eubacteriales bacterium]|nr:CDP-alcohol phosphatidyltransferase family protein [Eubacteriales bacterium]
MRIFEKKQIPNLLSILRFLMIPCFALVFFSSFPYHRVYALGIFVLAGITDVIDGYIARKHNWITEFGKMMDPLADKLMQATAFVCIAVKTRIGIFLAALICVKDILMLAGGIMLAKKGAKDLVVSKWYGKLSTCILAVTLGVLILSYENEKLAIIMAVISAGAMLFALLMYLILVYLKFLIKTDISADKTSEQ